MSSEQSLLRKTSSDLLSDSHVGKEHKLFDELIGLSTFLYVAILREALFVNSKGKLDLINLEGTIRHASRTELASQFLLLLPCENIHGGKV